MHDNRFLSTMLYAPAELTVNSGVWFIRVTLKMGDVINESCQGQLDISADVQILIMCISAETVSRELHSFCNGE